MEIKVGDEYIVEQVSTCCVREKERIVRCKDCKHLIANGAGCAYWDFCDIEDTNGYCAWGERREA
jgi:hypothetical protein